MKALISYFSIGGTTRKVANEVVSALKDEGHEVDLHEIGATPGPDLREYDAVGVASPTHFFRPPEPVSQFIQALPELAGRSFFTIVLHGTFVGDAGNRVRKQLSEKGGVDAGYFSTTGKDLWLAYLRRGQLFSPESPTVQDLEAARTFSQEVAQRIESGQHADRPAQADRDLGFVYRMERLVVSPWIVKNVYSRMFKATKACSGCGDCVEACPTANVSQASDMRPRWGQKCIFCLNCELQCPEDAIRSAADMKVMAPFMRYNIQKALADPNIESARVEFTGGTVRRLD